MCFKGPIARHCSECRTLIREDPKYQSFCYSMVLTRQCDRQVTREPFEWTKVFNDVCASCKAVGDGKPQATKVEPVTTSKDNIDKATVQDQSTNSWKPAVKDVEPDRPSFNELKGEIDVIRAICQFFQWDFGLILAVIAIALLLSAGSASELASWH
ncbi:hypothetical protein LTR10_017164 [Elasticomyces elasticus]|uniref:Uncharacterized protein n=1 Tax=Exophiala sideris TaxID=1016849 RepID=A0ABR0J548_9EURO|nr:hypothetical protein LTR10_017164 [Elasticomyces elasticus]KAK5028480.1 hypothetical protein LTS07_006571 [Exophiala sideris]KAK5035878.1 hypothetical protein LTR13_005448 [Exophiala sideris]KAK5056914.1 hypothetical protein LTR69_007552 [Exophiala sideris]KAK5181321.1 hypothetical protein LTR44_006116 [Eurotiomycetes sp. CCFEE 6388]